MTRLFRVMLFLLFTLFYTGVISSVADTQSCKRIILTPIPKPSTAYGTLGFEFQAPWMDGPITMRFPETLNSSLGLHFIDHDRADMRPISPMVQFPAWEVNSETGEIGYSYFLPEGIEFGGIVEATSDAVFMDFFVKNHTDEKITSVIPQMCMAMTKCNDFNTLNSISDIYMWSGGKYTSLGDCTPSPEEKGRSPLIIIARKGFVPPQGLGGDVGDTGVKATWWYLNQTSDEDIIVRESKDKKHLVAVTWPGYVHRLVCNAGIPCLHAGPTAGISIAPHREHHWYGIVYLMENNSDALYKRFKGAERD
jgi:hypothetical protein